MNKQEIKKVNKAGVPKKDTRFKLKQQQYDEFILWFASPPNIKRALGIDTQTEYAMQQNLAEATLSRWKARQDFEPRVRELRKKWAFDKTGEVIYGIYKAAVKGNDKSQKLWMQVFEGFTEKTEEVKTLKVEISPNDIRHIIQSLPDELQDKHYDNLRDLYIDAENVRRAGQLENSDIDLGFAEEILDETDNDAQVLQDERTDAVPYGYSTSVCSNMERQVSTCNYQSAAWWG